MSKIFLVDDDPIFTEVLSQYITEIGGFEIYKFNSGEDCLSNLDKEPEIIFLDQNFGMSSGEHIDGKETLVRIKKTNPSIKIIMLTGVEDNSLFKEFMKLGAEDYIPKDENTFSALKTII